MSWKTDLKCSDLDATMRIEVKCIRCGRIRYEAGDDLAAREDLRQLYLDELESVLRCSTRLCGGAVRIAPSHQHKVEGFVGGMA